MNNENQIAALNHLLARTKDAENGYKEAAKNVSDKKLQSIFETNAEQRYAFSHEIKDCINNLGGTPEADQTIAGQAHQVWMEIKTAFASNDDKTVLSEVNRGEQYSIEAYENALDNLQIGTPEYDRIVAQRNQVRSVYERTQSLENVYASA